MFLKNLSNFLQAEKRSAPAPHAQAFSVLSPRRTRREKNSFKIITDLFRKRLAALFPSVRAMILLAFSFVKKTRF